MYEYRQLTDQQKKQLQKQQAKQIATSSPTPSHAKSFPMLNSASAGIGGDSHAPPANMDTPKVPGQRWNWNLTKYVNTDVAGTEGVVSEACGRGRACVHVAVGVRACVCACVRACVRACV